MGKPIVMGRKTFDSIGRLLPGRPNIVVSRNPAFAADGIEVFCSLEAAIDGATQHEAEEVLIIGGAALYEEALPTADRIYLTEVHADVPGDVSFPAIDAGDWAEISRERRDAGDRDDHDFSFVILDRVNSV